MNKLTFKSPLLAYPPFCSFIMKLSRCVIQLSNRLTTTQIKQSKVASEFIFKRLFAVGSNRTQNGLVFKCFSKKRLDKLLKALPKEQRFGTEDGIFRYSGHIHI